MSTTTTHETTETARASCALQDAIDDEISREMPGMPAPRRREIAARCTVRALDVIANEHEMTAASWRIEQAAAVAEADDLARRRVGAGDVA